MLRESFIDSLVMMNSTLRARSALLPVRALLASVATTLALLGSSAAWAQGFDFEAVDKLARALAAKPYNGSAPPLPKALKDLNYDQMRDIRFDPSRVAVARGQVAVRVGVLPSWRPFHTIRCAYTKWSAGGPGDIRSTRPTSTMARRVLIVRSCDELGFAGFPCALALNTPRYKDELLVFLGASYFRALGQGQRYRHRRRVVWRWTPANARRGISTLRTVLDRAADAQRARTHRLRIARLAARDAVPIDSSFARVRRPSPT